MADNDLQSAPRIVVGGSERRTADRIAYEVDAELRVGTNIVHARTENVSASGVFLSVPSLLIVGSRVNVRFALPAGSFEADSTVVRLRPTGERGPGVGLMFHDVPSEFRMRLDMMCPPAKAIVRDGPG
ncbi:MAG: PilZ domain-containing protein [Myxococcales bacterium]|nr:PilZ domain-containing protein [Myxococcales bacterium]